MTIFESLILGLLQGITEFLPISSSGHLVLVESFMELPVKDLLVFDIAVHFGTLLAIFIYFRADFWSLLKAFWGMRLVKWKDLRSGGRSWDKDEKMIGYLIVGTIPAVIVGLLFGDLLESVFRSSLSVAVVMILVAVYYVVAENVAKRFVGDKRSGYSDEDGLPEKVGAKKFGLAQAVIIGIAQAAALVPGISRSGSTIATGLTQGLARREAARFSFLLGAVAITAATSLSIVKMIVGDFAIPDVAVLFTGIVSAFISGYASVWFLMLFLRKHSLVVFSVYLLGLAGGVILL